MHACVHAPLMHAWPGSQRLPHAPQLFGSVAVFAHVPPGHAVAGALHTQAPIAHVPPDPQRMPQPPQLFGSVW